MARPVHVAHLALLACCFGLAGCRPYYRPYDQQTGFGFLDQRVGEALYYVEYLGPDGMEPDLARELFLRRCAELTLESGYRYFRLVDRGVGGNRAELRYVAPSCTSPAYAACMRGGVGAVCAVGAIPTRCSPGHYEVERRAKFNGTVKVSHDARGMHFDATRFLSR